MNMYIVVVLLYTTMMLETVKSFSLAKNQKGSKPEDDDGRLTESEKDVLLEAHNMFRRHSKAHKMPQAGDMQLMTWDDTLATAAQGWADRCIWGHPKDTDRMRYLPDGKLYGQNLVIARARGDPAKKGWMYMLTSNMTDQVEAWYKEVKLYKWPKYCSGGWEPCGHYTQLMWAKSSLVGCAAQNCRFTSIKNPAWTGVSRVVVCNYYKPGNGGDKIPYKTSTAPCAKCPSNKPACNDGLCAPLRNEAGDCMQTCLNGGKPCPDTCKCQCADGYYNTYYAGNMCQRGCKDYSPKCDNFKKTKYRKYCFEKTGVRNFRSSMYWKKIQYWCPLSCGLCEKKTC